MAESDLKAPAAKHIMSSIQIIEKQIKTLEETIAWSGKMDWDLHLLIANELADLELRGFPIMARTLTKDYGEAIVCGFRRAGVRLKIKHVTQAGE